ncbi:transposable element Tcb1 transposase [Trichonephila clavipes]|nr:transposable element Tcb1 transposase [Trichonephila clavipes]
MDSSAHKRSYFGKTYIYVQKIDALTERDIYKHRRHITVSARNIQRRLQQSGRSARYPLLGLPLTQNHRRLRRQWGDERRMWVAEWNEVVFTDESRICLQYHDGRIRVWRHHGEMMMNNYATHRHTGPAPGIMVLGGIRYHSRTPLVRIAGTLNSQRYISEVLEPVVLPYLQGLAVTNLYGTFPLIFLGVFLGNIYSRLFPINSKKKYGIFKLDKITPQGATSDQLWQRVEAAWSAVLQEHIQRLFESMSRRVAAGISNNGGCSGY